MNQTEKQIDFTDDNFAAAVETRLRKMGVVIAVCRSCNQPIIFLPTKSGRSMPVAMTLKSHFADCPAADKFRK